MYTQCPESCYTVKFASDYTRHEKEDLRERDVNFYFSFRDFSYLNISQIPKTDVFTFVNNIGGGLGLFMGIAFPNLVEFIHFVIEIGVVALTN